MQEGSAVKKPEEVSRCFRTVRNYRGEGPLGSDGGECQILGVMKRNRIAAMVHAMLANGG